MLANARTHAIYDVGDIRGEPVVNFARALDVGFGTQRIVARLPANHGQGERRMIND
jgi:hypothetical protein